ncbi:hypothetical protein OSB04_028454 [Centaurea solstitialis]|uniref:Transposase-associated domain-containing protein n=1 Tax=Centaurea solstitialis TaxID=347529 RepID=A0AA38SGI4_9ASTR|nr:hypothetical protein OSB04_028454 [Centaurea solstitialis]
MFSIESSNGNILCPCIKCGNEAWVNLEEARMHLICNGFLKGYRIPPSISQPSCPTLETLDDMQGLVHDAFGNLDENIFEDENICEGEVDIEEEEPDEPNAEAKSFINYWKMQRKNYILGAKSSLYFHLSLNCFIASA